MHQLYSVKRICEERGEKAHIVVGGDEIREASNFSKPTPEAVEDLKELLYLQDYIQEIEAYSGTTPTIPSSFVPRCCGNTTPPIRRSSFLA